MGWVVGCVQKTGPSIDVNRQQPCHHAFFNNFNAASFLGTNSEQLSAIEERQACKPRSYVNSKLGPLSDLLTGVGSTATSLADKYVAQKLWQPTVVS